MNFSIFICNLRNSNPGCVIGSNENNIYHGGYNSPDKASGIHPLKINVKQLKFIYRCIFNSTLNFLGDHV